MNGFISPAVNPENIHFPQTTSLLPTSTESDLKWKNTDRRHYQPPPEPMRTQSVCYVTCIWVKLVYTGLVLMKENSFDLSCCDSKKGPKPPDRCRRVQSVCVTLWSIQETMSPGSASRVFTVKRSEIKLSCWSQTEKTDQLSERLLKSRSSWRVDVWTSKFHLLLVLEK